MSTEHYQRVLCLLPEAAALVTPIGKIVATNESATQVLRIQSAPESLLEALPPEHLNNAKAYLLRCARSKQPLIGSLHIKHATQEVRYTCYGALLEPRKDGQDAIILLRLIPREEANVRFHTLQKKIDDLNREIAQRLKAEQILTTQTQWLEVTLKSIADAVIITDSSNCVTFLNPVAEAATGWLLADARGKPLKDVFVIINEYTGEAVENPAEKALREGAVVALANHTVLISKNKQHIAIEDTAAPILLDGQIKGVVLVFYDVSEKRQLERELMERASRLESLNHRKNEFLTMLSHELRSPLTSISNAAHLMKMAGGSSPASDKPRQVIERQTRHLKRLIDDMLDVSRITLNKMKIVKADVNFTRLVQNTCIDFKPQFDQSQISLISLISPGTIWIDADADRITQVLHNLLTNALKFTSKNGEVHVSLIKDDGMGILIVKDNGIGIDLAAISDLFEPFTQAEQTLDRSEGGLELGLSLVKGIVDLHGGEVTVQSEGAGLGTRFSVALPLVETASLEYSEDSKQSALDRHHRILLIEDDQDAGATMSELLALMGHEVYWATTGPEGLKKAIAVAPSLIICDIGLPGLDGFAVAQRLRDNEATRAIPLVALTGYGDSEFVLRAKQSGFDHHITKPASLSDIKAALDIA